MVFIFFYCFYNCLIFHIIVNFLLMALDLQYLLSFFFLFSHTMFIVVRQYTKANSSYVNSYLAINLILCFLLLRPGVCTLTRVSVCVEHEPEEEVGLLSETKQQSKAFPV